MPGMVSSNKLSPTEQDGLKSSSRIKEMTKERILKENEKLHKLQIQAHERTKQEMRRKAEERHHLFLTYLRRKQQEWKRKTASSPLHDDLTSDIHEILKVLHSQSSHRSPKKVVLREITQKEFSPSDEELVKPLLNEQETLVLSAFKLSRTLRQVKDEEEKLSKSIELQLQKSFRRFRVTEKRK